MALVIQNVRLAHRIYRLTVQGSYSARMGQFFMLRCWDAYPVLSRPISVHNLTEDSVSFYIACREPVRGCCRRFKRVTKYSWKGLSDKGFLNPKDERHWWEAVLSGSAAARS